MAEAFFNYKGYPLVRKGKELYYGNMSDEYVCMITIMSTHKVKELDVADKVRVYLMLTDEGETDLSKKLVKNIDRQGLYEALDVASTWLSKTM